MTEIMLNGATAEILSWLSGLQEVMLVDDEQQPVAVMMTYTHYQSLASKLDVLETMVSNIRFEFEPNIGAEPELSAIALVGDRRISEAINEYLATKSFETDPVLDYMQLASWPKEEW